MKINNVYKNFYCNFYIAILGVLIFTGSCKESDIKLESLTKEQTIIAKLKSAHIGTNYYVSKTGSDSNAGTFSAPLLTIQKAANMVVAGDTVFIREGVYPECVKFSTSGTSEYPINIIAYPSEIPIIDGNNFTIPTEDYAPILKISGNHINITGLEVRNSHGMGVELTGKYDIADGIYAHHNLQSGILVTGDYGVVQNSIAYSNAMNNYEGKASLNGSGISAARNPNNAILRNNLVYENWGEGLSTFEANGTLIEDNTVYDNWSANIYISDVTNIIVRRNFVYRTKDMIRGSQVGILLGDEKNMPQSANITVIYNVVYGCKRNLYWWGSNYATGMTNFLFANNIFVNSIYSSCVQFNHSGTDSDVRFENNIILQNKGLLPILLSSNVGFSYSNNLWSETPNLLARSKVDIIGDPLLTDIKSPFVETSYKLRLGSPAINAGVNVGLTTDFSQNTIVGSPDIGAYEYTGSNSPSTTYYNTQASASATKNDCETGNMGSTVIYTIPAKKYSSTISQANADNKALEDLNNNKQAYANTNGTCTPSVTIYYNTQVSATARKNSCGPGYRGSTETYTVEAEKYSSTVSQADADEMALTDLLNNKQTYANDNGTCTAIRIYRWRRFFGNY